MSALVLGRHRPRSPKADSRSNTLPIRSSGRGGLYRLSLAFFRNETRRFPSCAKIGHLAVVRPRGTFRFSSRWDATTFPSDVGGSEVKRGQSCEGPLSRARRRLECLAGRDPQSLTEVIALKLGRFIHAEQDVTPMDITSLIEEAIQKDILQHRAHISHQRRAIERVTKLQGRVKCRSSDAENRLDRVLNWHEHSAKYFIKKDKAAVRTMERALEILQDYSFADDMPVPLPDDLSVALHDVLECLKQAGQSHLGRC